jgi:metal-sulfur cluster biosynthetic enzyme
MSEEHSTPKTVWDLDDSDPELAAAVRQGLRQVMDPELGMSVIDLGLVRQLSRVEDHLVAKMILTTPFCPYAPMLLESARSKIASVSGLESRIEFSPDLWDPSMMEGGREAAWGLF